MMGKMNIKNAFTHSRLFALALLLLCFTASAAFAETISIGQDGLTIGGQVVSTNGIPAGATSYNTSNGAFTNSANELLGYGQYQQNGVTGASNWQVLQQNGQNWTQSTYDDAGNLLGTAQYDAAGNFLGAGAGTEANKKLGDYKELNEVCQIEIDDGKDLKVVSVAIKCFEKMTENLAIEGMQNISNYLADAVFALLVLYLIIFGARVTTGIVNEQRVKGEFFIHSLKIAFVSWLVLNAGVIELWGIVQSIYNSLIVIVLAPAGDATMADCPIAEATTDGVWTAMDCILSRFLGWGAPNAYGEGWEGVPMLFGFGTHAITNGFGGIMIAGIVLSTIWTLLMSFFRVAFVYIISMLGLILLFIIAPITIPMVLFPQTKQYFEGWYKIVVS
ncbi:MAG: hypothetical protein COV36_04005, partial [Alphaproteobacteria bacterium CG11_big_fil_rev_8_21_14_0_20_44_7]